MLQVSRGRPFITSIANGLEQTEAGRDKLTGAPWWNFAPCDSGFWREWRIIQQNFPWWIVMSVIFDMSCMELKLFRS